MTDEPTRPGPGRPTDYTPEKADLICAMIAEGKSVRSICKMDGMPELPTFYRWLRTHDEFCKQYARAKEDQMEFYAEEIIDISDDGTNDFVEGSDKKGNPITVFDKEHVQRSRLRVDSRKWLMGKLKPKKYGDGATIRQQQLDKEGEPVDPVAPVGPDAYLQAAMAAVEKARGDGSEG